MHKLLCVFLPLWQELSDLVKLKFERENFQRSCKRKAKKAFTEIAKGSKAVTTDKC
jgi:hypothetical protein